MPIEFARPWMLLLLALLPLFWWVHLHSLAALPLWQRRAALVARLVIVTLVVLALAGARWVRTATTQAVFFVVDGSASVPAEYREQAAQFIREAVRHMRYDDTAGLIVFGNEPHLVIPLSHRLEGFLSVPPSRSAEATDIGRALSLALAAFPENVGKQIVLFSDGNANAGDTQLHALQAAGRGVRVHVVPFSWQLNREVLIERVQNPSLVPEGAPFELQTWIRSTHDQVARVRLLRDGQPVRAEEVSLRRGKNLVRLSHREEQGGSYRYQILLEPEVDTLPQNNRASSYVRVQGMPQVLYITADGNATPLANALRAQRIRVKVVSPAGAPALVAQLQGYDAVLLHNVPAYELGFPSMRALQAATRDIGVGLGMIGGENSFGAGGYFETPVEEALPVSMDVRKYHFLPGVGIVLIVDDSGSMAAMEGSVTKMELANRAAAAVVRFLGNQDEVGVIAAGSDCRAVVPMWRVGEKKEEILQAIAAFRPGGGGIYVRPGLEAAAKLIRGSQARLKHLIMLADGDDCDDQEGAIPLATQLRREGITLSVVCFGRGKDEVFLQQLAKAGGGRYYFTDRLTNLPQIFTKEALIAGKAQYVEEPFYVRYSNDELVAGFDWQNAPPLLGYNTTTAKPGARVPLWSHQEDPIFAVWQYGVGRSMAFTSDGKAKWCVQWVRWAPFPAFAARMVRAVLRSPPAEDVRTHVQVEGARGRVTIDLLQPAPTAQPPVLEACLYTPTGESVPLSLSQTGITRYEASFDARGYGTYVVVVQHQQPDGKTQVSIGMNTVAYSPEYRDLASNEQVLQQVARLTGGKVQPAPQEIFGSQRNPVRLPIEVSVSLLFAAMVLLPLDIALRRVVWHADALADWQHVWSTFTARWRRSSPASSTRSTARLLKRKDALRQRYSASRPPVTPPASSDTIVTPPEQTPTKHPSTPTEQVSRLLEAKKRVRHRDE